MASFGGFGFNLTDIIIVCSFILVAFIFYYNKSLKAVDVTARMFYSNHSSEDLPAKEIFDENRLEVTITKSGGLFSKNKSKESKTLNYELKGLPSEHRLGATKRSRIYYVTQGGTETISFTAIDTDTGDPVKQIILQTSAQVRSAQQAMHQQENKGFKNMLPGIFIGSGMTFAVLYFIRLVFPSVAF